MKQRRTAAQPGQTLDEIEGVDWGEPTYSSHLVRTCHALRKKPLGEFTVEDLRILLGQRISPAILLPLALDRLDDNLLTDGDYYEGDLLVAVFRQEAEFWSANPVWRGRLAALVRAGLADLEFDADVREIARQWLAQWGTPGR